MTPERLAEIRARLEAATPGPWAIYGTIGFEYHVRTGGTTAAVPTTGEPVADAALNRDAEFIAHAPTDIADLLAEVELLQTYITTNAVLRQRIRELEARNGDPRWKELAGELAEGLRGVLSQNAAYRVGTRPSDRNLDRALTARPALARYDSMMEGK